MPESQGGDAIAKAQFTAHFTCFTSTKVHILTPEELLDSNKLESEGGEAIAKALKRNQSLLTLDLGDNQIGDLSSTKIAEALKGSTSLTSLQVGSSLALGLF